MNISVFPVVWAGLLEESPGWRVGFPSAAAHGGQTVPPGGLIAIPWRNPLP
jgi:hypothetical protein